MLAASFSVFALFLFLHFYLLLIDTHYFYIGGKERDFIQWKMDAAVRLVLS